MEKYNWNYPTIMWVGEKRINDLSLACKNLNITKPLIVTDNNLSNFNIIKNILSNLKNNNFFVELFSDIVGNPTGTNVEDGTNFYKKNNCNGVIAIGGGSVDVGKQ